ncbi:SCP2 sterol-binding domain-containing protein [Halomarina litorea]|uniref:SCP2 sterol-binding domain-containing protein n=1 Tax=Halomarina litorea TaxID=2961595 RepID=UPI0020C54F19|nr:SCP2 sterol-binding domain-containing protein [Halomarina sp. BCD28]
MALKLPSEADEWISVWREHLNDSEAYAEKGTGWGVGFDGDFVFVIEPDDTYPGDPVYLFVGLEDGRCTDAYEVGSPDEVDHGFVYRGPYTNWKGLVEGDVGAMDGLMSGKFDLDGDMQKVLQYSDAAVVMTENAAAIDTEFEY